MTLSERLTNYAGSAAAAGRYAGTFASGAVMAVGILGVSAINPQEIERLFKALQDLGSATSSVLASLSTISGIVLGIWGAFKASRAQQTKTVNQIPGVQVHVDTSPDSPAPPQVKALAETPASVDPKVADVVPMDGPPVMSKS